MTKHINQLQLQDKLDNFFSYASAVQVEDGTWYYEQASVERELVKLYCKDADLKAELNETAEKLSKFEAENQILRAKLNEIPPEPTPEILEVLYGGLYRLDTNFGKIRAKTRYRKMVAMLQQQESFEPTTRSDDVFLRGEMNENY